ncbi:MAG: hypothetical protein QM751_05500 [Paludibacteraceae bacterium]
MKQADLAQDTNLCGYIQTSFSKSLKVDILGIKLKRRFLAALVGFLILSNLTAFSQSDQYIGLEYGLGTSLDDVNHTSFGITYENRFSNHFGFESGILNRTNYDSMYKFSYLEIPVSIKFYSKAININLGANGGLFTGARSYSSGILNWDTPLSIAAQIKLSHDFVLSSALTLEPSIYCIPFSTLDDNVLFGIGIKLKYLL